MLYTITFSQKDENGMRVPLLDENGREVTQQVEADSRSGAIYHVEVVAFCEQNDCKPRRVLP